MKLRVYAVSGPSWQPVKDGKPYNKWVGTIQYSDVSRVMFGRRYSAIISGDTKQEVENKLVSFHIGDIVSVPAKNLFGLNPGGNHADA